VSKTSPGAKRALWPGLSGLVLLLVALLLISSCSPVKAAQSASQSLSLKKVPGTPEEATLNLFDVGPQTLDPALAREVTSMNYICEIFSGLVSFDPKLNLIPDIASRWEVSEDGRTYIFFLRRGVRFHNGREVKAQDFKYSLERACDPRTGSRTAATYLGDIVGAMEKLAGRAREVRGIKVLDDYTLQITIDAPKVYFLQKLAHPCAYVVDRENVESGADWWRHPNGTGPFKLKKWEKDKLLILERNDSYYGQLPELKQVVFKLWGGVPMMLYEKGEIDLTHVPGVAIERVLDPTNPLHRELVEVPQLSIFYLGFNCARPPFDDPKVRQAFSLAVDKDKIIRLVLKGMVKRADGILPPGLPGYNPDLIGLTYDPERAKQLLQESKYGEDLPPLILTTAGRGELSNLDGALVDMWRRNLGVEVKVRQLEPEKYAYVLREEKDHMFELGWVADYPDPQNFLDVLFHSGAEENIGEYHNPRFDALLEQARAERDGKARLALYRQAEELLVQDAACLPLFFDVDYVLVKPYVKGFVGTPMPIPWLKYIWLERK